MSKINHKKLAKRLVLNAIENYRTKFILEVDILSNEDKRQILNEIDKVVLKLNEKEMEDYK
jgi:hypothetical protein